VMSEAGFKLRKWNYNKKEPERFFEKEEMKEKGVNLEISD